MVTGLLPSSSEAFHPSSSRVRYFLFNLTDKMCEQCSVRIAANKMKTPYIGIFMKFLFISVMFLALFYLDTFISSGFERILKSVGSSVISSSSNSSSLRRLQEVAPHLRRQVTFTNRKLLLAELCSKSDISIVQGELNPLPNGIPTFSVQIINLCPVGCAVTNIHVACGWFASAKLINPQVFRRLTFNDCLVNDGNRLDGGDSVSFEYSNSFEYPMRIEAAAVCRSP